ncbi:hypothetical protein AB0M39_35215 [Streptomyces sp. NPDC051907]|uniref:hypothetical protein n=1 Tax=Streptomyces sp. NPDC051907 TaxID=3155284 RepID=UPI00341C10CD
MAAPAPPAPEAADPQLGPLLQSFVACVAAELAAAGRPPCAACLVWGNSYPPADFCDCDCANGHGQAWVRLVRLDPAATGNRIAMKKCQPVRVRAWVEAGVYRCVPTVGPDGSSAPTCEQRSAAAWGFLADARALRTAFACCEALGDRPKELMSEDPIGSLGGCAGVALQFTVDL